ncbi:hypothetical protein [Ruminococcus flavefaciens]|uniref:hypothetical protein n=1 Tax=Ruminococcus flavefaciens TaxID=1265 RepID=UPI0026F22624|nr:hypothetical protein [Ruminococcus flavefaciens]
MSDYSVLLEMDVSAEKYGFNSSIVAAINDAEEELTSIDESIESIKRMRIDCDKTDYILSACSGVLCGIMDVFLVGKPNESPIEKLTDKWFANRTVDFAKLCGWKGRSELSSAVRFLEKRFKVPYDQHGAGDIIAKELLDLTPSNHHFKSLAHNPTLAGLFFSILDQFNNTSHFVSEGQLITIDNASGSFELKGNSIPAKLLCGFVNWFGHLISAVSGSSGSKSRGSGIPSPMWSWVNDIIALKRKLNIPTSEFDKNINDLAVKIFKEGFDVRFQTAQAVPVLVNDLIVRFIYAVRRMIKYFSDTNGMERSFISMWKSCEPFSNPSVMRMLSVAHGTFCLVDAGDAVIRGFAAGAGSFNICEFFLRLNIAGIGRFTISLYGEAKRGIAVLKQENENVFMLRKKHIIQDYVNGLKELYSMYDDVELLRFIDDLEESDMYKLAFAKSAELAAKRSVPADKILKSKNDIDDFFGGAR